MFKKWVIDAFLQKWYNDINMCNCLLNLKHYKINFGYKMYLDIVVITQQTRLRLGDKSNFKHSHHYVYAILLTPIMAIYLS